MLHEANKRFIYTLFVISGLIGFALLMAFVIAVPHDMFKDRPVFYYQLNFLMANMANIATVYLFLDECSIRPVTSCPTDIRAENSCSRCFYSVVVIISWMTTLYTSAMLFSMDEFFTASFWLVPIWLLSNVLMLLTEIAYLKEIWTTIRYSDYDSINV